MRRGPRKRESRSPARATTKPEVIAEEIGLNGSIRQFRTSAERGGPLLVTRVSGAATGARALAPATGARALAPGVRAWRTWLGGEVASVFLPAGYPDSVRAEYLYFQAFDTLQAACSYLRNILTTSAILRGAGVGEGAASPMAAAIAWVLRDGFGMFGSLVFSYFFGSRFDRNVKEWRLFADLINDVGLTLDMLAPLTGSSTGFAVVAALGAACKSICGMVAGACRASVTAHFALRGNLADVSAKEGAQETAVTLVGLGVGTAVARHLGDSQLTCWVAFITLTLLHVVANWVGVGCLALTNLNGQRAYLLCSGWWTERQVASQTEPTLSEANCPLRSLTPSEIALRERPWRPLVR